MAINVLYVNCRQTWPKSACWFANVYGYISTTLWFVVLVLQIRKNRRRRSVEGLSILWATANFTASLVNFFFAFSGEPLPLYTKISAGYMPILEFVILVQFWRYSKHAVQMKCCFLIWIAVIILELAVENAAPNAQWIAIVLWSVQSFSQVILNMRLRTTSGQATPSVVLGLFGKTADFLANYLLLLPSQYVVMTYFTSTLTYINGIQVIWYRKPQPPKTTKTRATYGSCGNSSEEALEANVSVEVHRASVEEVVSICSVVRANFEFRARIRDIPSYQLFFLGYLLLAIAVFSVCVCVNTNTTWGIFAPLVVAVVLFGALLCRNHREGRMHFADSLLAWFDSCCADQPVESTCLTRE